MTIRQLKEALGRFPDDTQVLVQGYEGGLCDIGFLRQSKVKLNVHSESWNGPHEETQDGDTEAVIIFREENPLATE